MIEATFFLESQSNSEEIAKKGIENLIGTIKSIEGTDIKKVDHDDTVRDGEIYSSTAETEIMFKDLGGYLMASMRCAPTSIIIDSPDRMEISSKEFLSVLGTTIALARKFLDKYNLSTRLPDIESEESKPAGQEKDEDGGDGLLTEDEIDGLVDQGALRVKIVFEKVNPKLRVLSGELKKLLEEKERLEGTKNKSKEKRIKELEDSIKNIEGEIKDAGEDLGDVETQFLNALKERAFVHRIKSVAHDYSSLVAINAFIYEPKTLVELSVKLVPVLVDVLEPEIMKLSRFDIQDIGVELASHYFEVSHLVIQRNSPS